MNKIDNKTKRIIASILHSKTVTLKAPNYVVLAIEQWIEELETETDVLSDFTDTVSVTDHATLELKNEGKLN